MMSVVSARHISAPWNRKTPNPTGRAQDLYDGTGNFVDSGQRWAEIETTAAASAELIPADGQYLTLADGDHFMADVIVIGAQADGSTGYYHRRVAIKREGATTSLSGSVQTIGTDTADAGLGTPTIAVTADASNNRLKVAVTPANSTSTYWVAFVQAYGFAF